MRAAEWDGVHFPWDDVEASRADRRLQSMKEIDVAKNRYVDRASDCPECGTPPEHLSWLYFRSPDRTWENLCGRAGYMTVCDWCHRQVDFFLEVMN